MTSLTYSLLIPTTKEPTNGITTTKDPRLLWKIDEILVSNVAGIGKARNDLAERATGDVLVYADDDIRIQKEAWDAVETLAPRTLLMLQGHSHPITRFMAVHLETYNELGGFDPFLTRNAEDYDFYWTALRKGIPVIELPSRYVKHVPHGKRLKTRDHLESAYTRVKHGNVTLHFFVQKNPLIAITRLLGLIYYNLKGTSV